MINSGRSARNQKGSIKTDKIEEFLNVFKKIKLAFLKK